MPLPVVPLLLVAAAALAASMSKANEGRPPGDTRTDPLPDSPLFDADLPRVTRLAAEAALVAGLPWTSYFAAAMQLQTQGYPKTAQTYLAVCNQGRQAQGLPPIAYPISAEAWAMVANQSQQGSPFQGSNWQGIDQTPAPGVPGPGGTAYGIPPTPAKPPLTQEQKDMISVIPRVAPPPVKVAPGVTLTAPPTPFVPPFVPPAAPPSLPAVPTGLVVTPLPGGGQTVTVPGLGSFTVPPGIMGGPPAPPAVYPTPPPVMPPPVAIKAPPPAAPPAPAKTYPAGTHTRPDGTFGYNTQTGDVSTQKIADKFGGQGADLMAANPGVDWQKNFPGSDLNVPLGWITLSSPPPAGPKGKLPPKKAGATLSAGTKAPPGTVTLPEVTIYALGALVEYTLPSLTGFTKG